jgi:hypothetical protein
VSSPEFEHLREDLDGLEEAELRQLIERSSLIEELTRHPGWRMYVDYLAALSLRMQDRVLKSYAKSFDEYRFETGKLAGLKTAIEAPERLQIQVAMAQHQAEQAREMSAELEEMY